MIGDAGVVFKNMVRHFVENAFNIHLYASNYCLFCFILLYFYLGACVENCGKNTNFDIT